MSKLSILLGKGSIVFLVFLILLVAASIIFPEVSPYPYDKVDLKAASQSPSVHHLLGTDTLGRDMLTRILYGVRVSLVIGFLVAAISTGFGVVIGVLAGFYGKWIDELLMRLTDIVLTLPLLPFLIVAGAFFSKGGVLGIATVLSLFLWMYVARLVRVSFLSLKEREYIKAAKIYGCSNIRLITVHMLPAVAGPILVNTLITLSLAIGSESVLSFLGFGIQPPTPSLGNLLYDAKAYVSDQPWLIWGPGVFVAAILVSVNFISSSIEQAIGRSDA